jgi:TetR/AcrR family transcriptional regulator, acrAB operon repressor
MRRSKEDSLKTRQAILVAARHVFARRGVTRTSMEHIARAAGVTRGAVYGHFRDKGALFQAMREHVKVPLVDVIDEALLDAPDRPLDGVQRYLLAVVEAMRDIPATRETFHILLFKCEYVGDVKVELERQADRVGELVGKLERAFRAASRRGQLRARMPARLAALETAAFLMGLVRLWLLDESGTLMRPEAARLIRAHVANLRRA